MARPARRLTFAPRPEPLEPRALLSLAPADLTGPRADPATSLLVGFAPGASEAAERALLRAAHARAVRSYPDGPTLVSVSPGTAPGAALARLRASRLVSYAVPNGTIQADAFVPNDPGLGDQWGLSSPNGVDIGALDAWQVTIGNPGTIVAVIDTGVDATHPELAPKIWANPGEAANGLDDDRNGFVDDLHGWNFTTNSPNTSDYNGHGTHVAGTIAAVTNNGIGGAGVDWLARIMPLKFLDSFGDGSMDDAVRAIYYAVNEGARVINASWGGDAYSAPLVAAINYANQHNVVFVTAAGNDGQNNDVTANFPADIRLPNMLSVAAVDQAGNLADFSNYGPRTVDVAAPGVNIRSTAPGGGYATYSGTSMAVPFVSGVASLLIGLHPDWSAAQVVQQIVATATPLPGLAGKIISGGMVSAARAVGVSGTNTTSAAGAPAASAGDPHALILASDEYDNASGGTPAGWAAALYRDVYGRPIDPGGLAYWAGLVRLGASRQQVASDMLHSTEAITTQLARWLSGDLNRPGTLAQLKADPGVQAAAAQVVAGRISLSAVHGQILGSDEFLAVHGGTADGFLAGLYQRVLGRDPDADGLAFWRRALDQGVRRTDVAAAIAGSPEGARVQVVGWVQQGLHRDAPLADLERDPSIISLAQMLLDGGGNGA